MDQKRKKDQQRPTYSSIAYITTECLSKFLFRGINLFSHFMG